MLAQLSDPHIGADWAGGDPTAAFAAAVETILSMPVEPDAILVSGDLSEHATDAEYEQVRELLAPLGAPVYVLPGNHDDRATLRRHFGRDAGAPVPVGEIAGSEAVVLERVDADKGMIKIDGEYWQARALDSAQVMEPGERVHVVEIKGVTAIVWRD